MKAGFVAEDTFSPRLDHRPEPLHYANRTEFSQRPNSREVFTWLSVARLLPLTLWKAPQMPEEQGTSTRTLSMERSCYAMWRRVINVSCELRRKYEHQNPYDDAVDGKRRETSLANPCHKPGDRSVGNDERDHEADGENDPLISGNL